jgi:hypothetical protein
MSAPIAVGHQWQVFYLALALSLICSITLIYFAYTRRFVPLFIGISLFPLTFSLFQFGAFLFRFVTGVGLEIVLVLILSFWALWLIPIVAPKISNKVVEEIVYPKTPMGRAFMGLFYSLAVLGGAGGSAIGRTLSKANRQGSSLGLLIFSIIVMIIGVVFHFMFIGQVWRDRDRFKQEELALKAEKAKRD